MVYRTAEQSPLEVIASRILNTWDHPDKGILRMELDEFLAIAGFRKLMEEYFGREKKSPLEAQCDTLLVRGHELAMLRVNGLARHGDEVVPMLHGICKGAHTLALYLAKNGRELLDVWAAKGYSKAYDFVYVKRKVSWDGANCDKHLVNYLVERHKLLTSSPSSSGNP